MEFQSRFEIKLLSSIAKFCAGVMLVLNSSYLNFYDCAKLLRQPLIYEICASIKNTLAT